MNNDNKKITLKELKEERKRIDSLIANRNEFDIDEPLDEIEEKLIRVFIDACEYLRDCSTKLHAFLPVNIKKVDISGHYGLDVEYYLSKGLRDYEDMSVKFNELLDISNALKAKAETEDKKGEDA